MDDLRSRLKRLGVTTGRDFKPKPHPQASGPAGDIHTLLPDGESVETSLGECFHLRRLYPLASVHGRQRLDAFMRLLPDTLAAIAGDPLLADCDIQQLVFLDTETTGLGGGAFAFQVGIGFFADDHFEVQQFFLRDPAEEAAMLALLGDILHPDAGLITFNGRTFDVPLLAGRYIMNRHPTGIQFLPHLDLLHPARRLWKRRLPSCALGSLENDILGIARTEDDVPGSLIPYLYQQYLKTKDARSMVRVLYHNEQDLLSMVSIAVILCEAFTHPDDPLLHIDDRLSLARWYERNGDHLQAEVTYSLAADQAPDAHTRYDALHGLAYLLKRANRRDEAVAYWEYLADLKHDTIGHEELAKHYEWQTGDLAQALHWTDAALALAASWRPGLRRTEVVQMFDHRKTRLLAKLAGQANTDQHEEE